MNDDARYSRQSRLKEVGLSGQARIEGGEPILIPAGPEAAHELAYLVRAGVPRVMVLRAFPMGVAAAGGRNGFEHAAHFRHAPMRNLAAGAWRALHELKRRLEASS